MLTNDQKNKMVEARLRDYDARIYDLEITICALLAVYDEAGAIETNKRIEALKKAREAVEQMKVIDDADAK